MKDKITDQLREALNILDEYPGIEHTLDVRNAQKFLDDISEHEVIMNAPSFEEVDVDELGEQIRETSLEDWLNALQELPGVFATDEIRDPDEKDDPALIWGAVDKHLNASKPDYDKTSSDEHYFEFEKNNIAYLFIPKNGANSQKGTWADIYKIIVEHADRNLKVPNIPDASDV